jgi:hypothetical protein
MKKFILLIVMAIPLILKAQVKSPGTAEAAFSSFLDRTGWSATANSGVGADGSYTALFDGDGTTYWNSNYGNAATNKYPHILTIDMQAAQTYGGIMIRPRQSGSRIPKNITFRKSDDGTTWTAIASFTCKKAVEDQYFYFNSSNTSRYLQLEITDSYSTDVNGELDEFAPFTTSVPDATAYSRSGWVATGSSTQGTGGSGDDGGYAATIDNNGTTYWHARWNKNDNTGREGPVSDSPTFGHYLEYDMLNAITINKISLINRPTNNGGRFVRFNVLYKVNSIDPWKTIGEPTPVEYSSTAANPTVNNVPLGTTITARYIKLQILETGGDFAMLAEFRAHYDQTLPVELTSFTAKSNGNSVSLAWTTASEKNASHFNITRSIDSRNFSVIGKVKAAGNTNEKQNYRFTDFAPLKGTNYYQLQQIDFDGTENPSDIVSAKITLNNSDLIVKQVNDRTATLNIVVTKASNGTIHVTNALGQKIAQKPVKLSEGLNTVTVSTGNSTNLLIFTLVTPEGILSKKIAK